MRVRTDLDVAGATAIIDGVVGTTVSLSADSTKTISSSLVAGVRYKIIFALTQNTTQGYIYLRCNNDSGNNYGYGQNYWGNSGEAVGGALAQSLWLFAHSNPHLIKAGELLLAEMFIYSHPSSTITMMQLKCGYVLYDPANYTCGCLVSGYYDGASDLNRLDITTSAGTMTGTVKIFTLN